MINKKYWDNDYYGFWNWFVKQWYDQRSGKGSIEEYRKIEEAYTQSVAERSNAELRLDELPTPYLGNPRDGVDAVIINLNPGLSDIIRFGKFIGENGDATQFFSNVDKPIGWLMREFRDNAEKDYSKFVGIDSSINWSCLNPDLLEYSEWVCGVDWWQGYSDDKIELKSRPPRKKDQRLPWLSRIYGKKILPERVFALELCPYHSKGFQLKIKNREYKAALAKFISMHVIKPAAKAMVENGLTFAVAVGAPNAYILKQIGARLIKTWRVIMGKDKNGKDNYRVYERYAVNADDGKEVDIVVTWQRINQGVPAPGRQFAEVEKQIFYATREQLDGKTVEIDLKSNSQYEKQQPKKIKSVKKPHAGTPKNTLAHQFWNAFKEWCKENDKTWCSGAVNSGTYYNPNGTTGKMHIFLKLGKRSIASFKDLEAFVAIGICCHKGEAQRQAIGQYQNEFSVLGELQDWTYAKSNDGDKQKNIYFVRKADWNDPNRWPQMFAQMAEDFEAVYKVLRTHTKI